MGLLESILGGDDGGGILGSVPIVGDVLGAIGGHQQRKQAQRFANDQMDFQERMSSTAYQRATKDMRAAGLNPAMMYKSGGAASSGTGASGQAVNPFQQRLNSATQISQIQNLQAQTQLTKNKANITALKSGVLGDVNTVYEKLRNLVLNPNSPDAKATMAILKRLGMFQDEKDLPGGGRSSGFLGTYKEWYEKKIPIKKPQNWK